MNIYDKNGYLDMDKIINLPYAFIFVVGARGIGKTYGALKYAIDNNIKTMIMRRTQQQCDFISKAQFAPIKTICDDEKIEYEVRPLSQSSAGYYINGEEKPLMVTCALSTISNMRGFDSSDINLIIYDEFIPEQHERLMKNEAEAFFNAYETINRNREINGGKPVKCLCLSNSNDILNPIFVSLKIVDLVGKMAEKRIDYYSDNKRGFAVIMPLNSPISQEKNATALYKLAGDEFKNMAISNKFENAKSRNVRHMNIAEFKPIAKIGEINIYRHKSMNQYYCTPYLSGVFNLVYGTNDGEINRARRELYFAIVAYASGRMTFETRLTEGLFCKFFGIK